MTRREFFAVAPVAGIGIRRRRSVLILPVRLMLDGQVKWKPETLDWFRRHLWTEAVEDLARCGVEVRTTIAEGKVERPSQREPVITGLERGVLNVVVTNTIPMVWDSGRSLAGVTTRYRGYHLSMAALSYAHGNLVPFISINTCLHEMLHAILGDVFESRPEGVRGEAREVRVDFHGTCLWVARRDEVVREAADRYVGRLRELLS